MSSNGRKMVHWLAPTAILLGIIVYQFTLPLSVIKSQASYSSGEIAGTNYLMGGGLHLANREGSFGEIEESELKSLISSNDGSCELDLPGFGNELSLYIQDYGKLENVDCAAVERPLTTSIRVNSSNGNYHLFYGLGRRGD